MYPHRIRLRGPWECEPLARLVRQLDGSLVADRDPLPPPRRITMPCYWQDGGLPDFVGRVRFRRRFGYPGRIDSHERVWLTFVGVVGKAEVHLNGQVMGPLEQGVGSFEFEVTSLLHDRNELIVDMESMEGKAGLAGEVALEVRCTAYLGDMHIWAEPGLDGPPRLHAAGLIVGACEGLLELYVIADRSTAAYECVHATHAGWPFHLIGEGLTVVEPQTTVRVELVQGSTVWYAWEALYPV